MVQTAGGSPEEGAGRQDDDMSNPMWAHIMRLLDDEEQAALVFQIFKQAMVTRAIETDLSDEDRAQHVAHTSALVAAELEGLASLKGSTDLQRRQQRPPRQTADEMIAKNKGTGEAVSDPEEDKQAANPPHHDRSSGSCCSSPASGVAGNVYSARRLGAWDGQLACSVPASLLRAKRACF